MRPSERFDLLRFLRTCRCIPDPYSIAFLDHTKAVVICETAKAVGKAALKLKKRPGPTLIVCPLFEVFGIDNYALFRLKKRHEDAVLYMLISKGAMLRESYYIDQMPSDVRRKVGLKPLPKRLRCLLQMYEKTRSLLEDNS